MTFSFPGDLLPCQLRSHFLTWYKVQAVCFVKAISFFIVWRRMGCMSGNTVDPYRFRFLNLMTSRPPKHKIPLNIYCSLPYEVLKSKARYILCITLNNSSKLLEMPGHFIKCDSNTNVYLTLELIYTVRITLFLQQSWKASLFLALRQSILHIPQSKMYTAFLKTLDCKLFNT